MNEQILAAQKAAGRRAKLAGDNFEGWLNTQHEIALFMRLIAWHRHVGVKVKWIGKGTSAKPTAIDVGPADYIMQAMNGRCIVVEAKSRANGVVMYSDVERHQRDHLSACLKGGGIALLLVELRDAIKLETGPNAVVLGARHVPAGRVKAYAIRRFAVPWDEVPWRVRRHAPGVDATDLAPWKIEHVQVGADCYLRRFLEAPARPAGR